MDDSNITGATTISPEADDEDLVPSIRGQVAGTRQVASVRPPGDMASVLPDDTPEETNGSGETPAGPRADVNPAGVEGDRTSRIADLVQVIKAAYDKMRSTS
jgi:hypothetical protein